MEEKFRRLFCLGWVMVWVMFASSRAKMRPRVVAIMAAVFVSMGIVIGGVCVGVMNDVMSRPATVLPKARRVIGLRVCGLFSFIGVIVGVRVDSACTRRVIRKLYVAVKVVARRVNNNAQVFR